MAATRPENPQELYSLALELVEEPAEDNFKQAISLLLTAKDLFGDTDDELRGRIFTLLINYYLAVANFQKNLGNYAEAKRLFERLIELCREETNPSSETLENLVRAHILLGDISENNSVEANRHFNKAEETLGKCKGTSTNFVFQFLSGFVLLRQRKYKEALDALDQCNDEALSFATYYNRGLCLQQLGEHGQAITCFNNAVHPDYRESQMSYMSLLALAKSYCELGQFSDAIMKLNVALEILKLCEIPHEDNPEIQIDFIVNAYHEVLNSGLPNSVSCVESSLRHLPDYMPKDEKTREQLASVYYRLGEYASKDQRRKEAEKYFKKHLELSRGDVNKILQCNIEDATKERIFSTIEQELKEVQKNIQEELYEQALELLEEPTGDNCEKALAPLLTAKALFGDTDDELRKRIFTLLINIYCVVAVLQKDRGNYDEAERLFREISKLCREEINPSSETQKILERVDVLLGDINKRKQDKALAAAHGFRFDGGSSDAVSYYFLGLCLQQLGGHRQATACFKIAAHSKNRSDEVAYKTWLAWAKSCCELRKFLDAIAKFDLALTIREQNRIPYKDNSDIQIDFIVNAYHETLNSLTLGSYEERSLRFLSAYTPEDEKARKQLASVYCRLGEYASKDQRWKRAEKYFKRHVELSKGDVSEILQCNFKGVAKEFIFRVITQQPEKVKIALLKGCVYPFTSLSKIMWTKQGVTNCSWTSGILKKIKQELEKLSDGTGKNLFWETVCEVIASGKDYEKFTDLKFGVLKYLLKQKTEEEQKDFLEKLLGQEGPYANFFWCQRGVARPNHGSGVLLEAKKILKILNRKETQETQKRLNEQTLVLHYYLGQPSQGDGPSEQLDDEIDMKELKPQGGGQSLQQFNVVVPISIFNQGSNSTTQSEAERLAAEATELQRQWLAKLEEINKLQGGSGTQSQQLKGSNTPR